MRCKGCLGVDIPLFQRYRSQYEVIHEVRSNDRSAFQRHGVPRCTGSFHQLGIYSGPAGKLQYDGRKAADNFGYTSFRYYKPIGKQRMRKRILIVQNSEIMSPVIREALDSGAFDLKWLSGRCPACR